MRKDFNQLGIFLMRLPREVTLEELMLGLANGFLLLSIDVTELRRLAELGATLFFLFKGIV
jgi:hypothetical protein